MNKRKVNITLIMDSEEEAQDFLNWIEHFSNVVDSRVFPLEKSKKQ